MGAVVGGASNQEKSFSASLDIVKLFTTLSTGALAFSIGLTSQATNNYPGGFRTAIIVGWFIFFGAIVSGIWAQMWAPVLINAGTPDPNAMVFRGPIAASVLLFLCGVVVLGWVLVGTAPLGAAGQRLAVATPAQAVAKALAGMDPASVAKVAVAEYLKGVDPVRPDQAAWHVQFELEPRKKTGTRVAAADKSATLDVYVDPVAGCSYAVQRVPHSRGDPHCLGL